MPKEGIAIIGIGCRFPGGVNDTESFWKLLAEGRDAVSEIPSDRFNVEDIAARVGKKRVTVTNTMRLLKLPQRLVSRRAALPPT